MDPTPVTPTTHEGNSGLVAKEVKPGYKTTEFWMTALNQLCGLVAASGALSDGNEILQYVGLGQMIITKIMYTMNRGQVKKAAGQN